MTKEEKKEKNILNQFKKFLKNYLEINNHFKVIYSINKLELQIFGSDKYQFNIYLCDVGILLGKSGHFIKDLEYEMKKYFEKDPRFFNYYFSIKVKKRDIFELEIIP